MSARGLWLIELFVAVCCFCGVAGQAGAETVAYWRFENADGDEGDIDDVVGGHDAVRATGGLGFSDGGLWNPVPNPDDDPGAGAVNCMKGDFGSGAQVNYAYAADDGDWTQPGGFTIEAMVNLSGSQDQAMVGHWDSFSHKSWSFEIESSGGTTHPVLRLHDGSEESTASFSGYDLAQGETSALAAAFDNAADTVTLYARREGEAFQKAVVDLGGAGKEFGTLNDPVGVNLHIGARKGLNMEAALAGYMDEVRFSSGALPESELLAYTDAVATPEPTAAALALVAGLAGAFAAWRRRSAGGSGLPEAR